MSKYEETVTVLAHEGYLVEALGYAPEVCRQGTPLFGYQGDERPERAHVVIRRNQLDSASNDIGFRRDANGVYRAIVSEYDRRLGFDGAWLGRVAPAYKERQAMAASKARGYVFQGRQVIETPEGRKVRLRFAAR